MIAHTIKPGDLIVLHFNKPMYVSPMHRTKDRLGVYAEKRGQICIVCSTSSARPDFSGADIQTKVSVITEGNLRWVYFDMNTNAYDCEIISV